MSNWANKKRIMVWVDIVTSVNEKYCSATIMLAKTAEISYAITVDHGDAP